MQRPVIINQVLDHLNFVFRLTKINLAEELNAVFSKFIFKKEPTWQWSYSVGGGVVLN